MNLQKSDIELAGHSNERYLNDPKSCSRVGGDSFMSNSSPFPPNNGVVLTISQIIKVVVSSAAEAELGSLFINSR